MDYIRNSSDGQLVFTQSTDFLRIPSCLYGFMNHSTSTEVTASGRIAFCFYGELDTSEDDITCQCGSKMHVNNHPGIILRHLPFGGYLSQVKFDRNQYVCPKYGKTRMQFISFKASGHRITEELHQYTRDLLATGNDTNKEVAEITGLGKNTVKDIDKQLHNGYKYATHIIDMETGHVLRIANGKKKQVVYDFIEHVGLAWMDTVWKPLPAT